MNIYPTYTDTIRRGEYVLNDKIVNQAIKEMHERRQSAVETHTKRIAEVEEKIPEIAQLNYQLSNSSREFIRAILTEKVDFQSRVKEAERNNHQIQSKISNLLLSNGYDKDYLKLKYRCEKCRDTGFKKDKDGLELNEYCDCLINLIKRLSAKQINQNYDVSLFSFNNFDLSLYSKNDYVPATHMTIYEHMRLVFETLQDYANSFHIDYRNPRDNPSNIIMYGKTGLGKTHLSMAVADVVINRGFSVVYNSASNIFSKLADENFSQSYADCPSRESLDTILNADLLILDDLGQEMENKFYSSVLYEILNTRIMKLLPTIINTNLLLDRPEQDLFSNDTSSLEERYDERIVSRILSYKRIEFIGNDIRTILHNKKNLEGKGCDITVDTIVKRR